MDIQSSLYFVSDKPDADAYIGVDSTVELICREKSGYQNKVGGVGLVITDLGNNVHPTLTKTYTYAVMH